MAPGFIAGKFTEALHRHTDQRVHAVGSRSTERAAEFAARYGIDRCYGSYAGFLEDPGVEIVYVASPHSEHRNLALQAIAAGKHVLVEKPIAVSADEAREIADAARAAGVFAMEAMHTRFHPYIDVIRQLLDDGVLGDIRLVTADLGLRFPVDHANRLYDPALGGGALLDLGVYPMWFSRFVLGRPQRLLATGSLTSTGVDGQAVVVLTTDSDRQAVVTTNLYAFSPSHASINGTAARIHVDSRFPQPSPFTLYGPDNRQHLRFVDESGITLQDGLCREAAAAAQDVADGLTESPLHSLAMSIGVLETIDEARRQLGVRQVA